MRRALFVTGVLLFVCMASRRFVAQAVSRFPEPPRICVAVIANRSTVSVDRDRLASRLAKNLKQSKFDVAIMDSATTMDPKLTPTEANAEEATQKQCDYTLLTQVIDIRTHRGLANPTQPFPGSPIPSIDATDPMGGSSGPVYRENHQINFALFQTDRAKPVIDAAILERAAANVSDTFLAGMDRISNRVTHDLKKQ